MKSLARSGNLLIGGVMLAQSLGGGAADAIATATLRAMRPVPQAGGPPTVIHVWVGPRQVVLPGGQIVVVPSHEERVISPTQVFVPALTVQTPGGQTLVVPAGERPPLEIRRGP